MTAGHWLLALVACATPLQVNTSPDVLAFVGATVLPMDGADARTPRVLADHTVLVRGDRIVAVGPRAEIDVPADATVIDAEGAWLMPGLADMHVHAWNPTDLTLFVAKGVTTVRNMFGAPLHLEWREEIRAGERLGPTIFTAGAIVDGRPPIWPGSRVAMTADEARAAVREQVAAGYDFVKVYNRLPKKAYTALVEAAREAGIPVDGHVPDEVGLEAVLASGQRTVEHLWGYGEHVCAHGVRDAKASHWLAALRAWDDLDEKKLVEMARRSKEAGVWNCVTLVVMKKWLDPEGVKRELGRPYIRYVTPFTLGMWKQMNEGMDPAMRDAGRGGSKGRMRFVRALRDAGARILLGTDTGNPYVAPGFALHEELGLLVRAGLTPYEALRAGTHDAAECLGELDEFGTIAPGLRADLLLLDSDPLEDVRAAADIVGVVVRGRWLPRTELAAMVAEIAGPRAADADEH